MPRKTKTHRPPVFKIRAEIEVWMRKDPNLSPPAILIVEECLATTTPNRHDLMALARANVMGKLEAFGADTTKLDDQFVHYEFFAARTREYTGTSFEDEPEWVKAFDTYVETADETARERAIHNLTYLPVDIKDQRAVYGA